MAKPPEVGSRLHIAKFIHEELTTNALHCKVIQPQVIVHFDDTFWWVAKIILIDDTVNSVGIIRKHEVGFAIVSEKNKKLKKEKLVISNIFS